ncbi:MAG TPA: putative ABC exporter domain-containing protein [Fimbriimonas sp.]|nr:putative ABC exporter domain-containing protein [Fimbriimonas sp.]
MQALALLNCLKLKNTVLGIAKDPRKGLGLLLSLAFLLFAVSNNPFARTLPLPHPEIIGQELLQKRPMLDLVTTGILAILLFATLPMAFAGNTLAFTPAEVDFIFASPIARRAVLIGRLPGLLQNSALGSLIVVLLFKFAEGGFMATAAGRSYSFWGGWVALTAMFTAMSVLSLSIEIRLGKRPLAAGIGGICLLAVAALVFWLISSKSPESASAILGWPLLGWLLAPAKACAEALSGGALGEPIHFAPLAIFLGLSSFLCFFQEVNYYEYAVAISEWLTKNREAIKAGQAIALPGRQHSSTHAREYALPPFGAGAISLLWANLSSLAKHPWLFITTPLTCGVVIPYLSARTAPEVTPLAVGMLNAMGLYLLVAFIPFPIRAAIRRQPIVRPLPLKGVSVALAEVAPAVLVLALLNIPSALVMLAFNSIAWGAYALVIGVGIPLIGLTLGLIAFACLSMFPDAQDPAQRLSAATLSVLVTSAYGFGLYELRRAASPWGMTAMIAAGCGFILISLAASALFAGWAYERSEPGGFRFGRAS